MNEGRKVHRGSFVAHSEATEVLQPRIGALNDPSVSVPLQFLSVLMGGDLVVLRDGMIDSMSCLASKARTLLLS
jgi:hypothetical protein